MTEMEDVEVYAERLRRRRQLVIGIGSALVGLAVLAGAVVAWLVNPELTRNFWKLAIIGAFFGLVVLGYGLRVLHEGEPPPEDDPAERR